MSNENMTEGAVKGTENTAGEKDSLLDFDDDPLSATTLPMGFSASL